MSLTVLVVNMPPGVSSYIWYVC